MRRMLAFLVLALVPGAARAATPVNADSIAIVRLLHEFLDGAGRNDAGVHDRFWAHDLVYTGSGGRRVGKADILKSVREAPAPKPEDPVTTYGAEAIRVRQYGSTAVLAFRLVATNRDKDATHVAHYLNTGTLVKRAGKWQVVSWQATRVVPSGDEARADIAKFEAAFRAALRAGVPSEFEALAEPDFVWTPAGSAALSRAETSARLAAPGGRLALRDADSLAIATWGETAIARAVLAKTPTGRHPVRGAPPPAGLDVAWSLTLVYHDGAWHAVALDTAAPRESAAAR